MAFFITEATNNKKKDLVSKKRAKVKNDDLVDPDDYMPKRFGLKYDPPTVVLEYMVMSLGKLYHHKMKLLRLTPESDVNEMVDYLYSRHGFYLKESVVSRQQIANLVIRLQKRMQLQNQAKAAKKENKAPEPPAKKTVEPPKKTVEAAKTVKKEEQIPSSYLPSVAQKKAPAKNNDWDDDGWGNDDDWGNSDDDKEKDYNNFNLNKLTVEELKKEKAKMDVDFEKNRKKPEDKDFEYDVRKSFGPPKED